MSKQIVGTERLLCLRGASCHPSTLEGLLVQPQLFRGVSPHKGVRPEASAETRDFRRVGRQDLISTADRDTQLNSPLLSKKSEPLRTVTPFWEDCVCIKRTLGCPRVYVSPQCVCVSVWGPHSTRNKTHLLHLALLCKRYCHQGNHTLTTWTPVVLKTITRSPRASSTWSCGKEVSPSLTLGLSKQWICVLKWNEPEVKGIYFSFFFILTGFPRIPEKVLRHVLLKNNSKRVVRNRKHLDWSYRVNKQFLKDWS